MQIVQMLLHFPMQMSCLSWLSFLVNQKVTIYSVKKKKKSDLKWHRCSQKINSSKWIYNLTCKCHNRKRLIS